MSYTIGNIRRWNTGALVTAATEVSMGRTAAEEASRTLSEGHDRLDNSWDGLAANAVLDAAETEKRHVIKLRDGLEDLTAELTRAEAALGPAVQTVKERIAEAEFVGLTVGEDSVGPAPGRDDVTQEVVDQHAESISQAIDTVRSLDEHYGRQIDVIASRLHDAFPPEVDRTPIPGPDSSWPIPAVDAITGAAGEGFPALAHDLDPETRGRHSLNPVPDHVGRNASTALRGLGRFAGPAGAAMTTYDGIDGYVKGETTAVEAAVETAGALGGGAFGGFAAGAAAGSFLGPVGTIVGAGIGAVVGSYLGQKVADEAHAAVAGGDDQAGGA